MSFSKIRWDLKWCSLESSVFGFLLRFCKFFDSFFALAAEVLLSSGRPSGRSSTSGSHYFRIHRWPDYHCWPDYRMVAIHPFLYLSWPLIGGRISNHLRNRRPVDLITIWSRFDGFYAISRLLLRGFSSLFLQPLTWCPWWCYWRLVPWSHTPDYHTVAVQVVSPFLEFDCSRGL